MRFYAHEDIKELAKTVLDTVKQIETAVAAELDELDKNDDLKDEVKRERRQMILDNAQNSYRAVREKFGGRVDRLADETRKLAQMIEPPAPNPANAALIQMLSVAPQVTAPMISSAAESISGDAVAFEILCQIAEKNGYGALLAQSAQTRQQHLTRQMLESVADDFQSSFKWYFDARKVYNAYPHGEMPDGMTYGEATVNAGERMQTTKQLEAIERGRAFAFGDDVTIGAEFSSLAANAEL